ncbi:MAG: hypothetical protein CMJ32_03770 [Phycisphaerae bacterium]|nr:hypothetical protein [Phycisphaerae bacterium]
MIGYCTNVHAGTSMDSMLENLDRFSVGVREALGLDEPLGVGLWIAAPAARSIREDESADRLRDWLGERNLVAYTLNGFPYGDFHSSVVKHAVYEPDWSSQERLQYSIDLAWILASLESAPTASSSISTVPLGWRTSMDTPGHMDAAADNLVTAAAELERIEQETGRWIHLDLEPEPGCVVDRSGDLVEYFTSHLHTRQEELSRRYLGVCHDICHAAVMFENQSDAIRAYVDGGVRIGKVQISACPEVDFESVDDQSREELKERLGRYREPRYLHQTGIIDINGAFHFHDDLPDALAGEPARGCWRTHFHVPVFAAELDGIGTTRELVRSCIDSLRITGTLPAMEVETYAWNVLPDPPGPGELPGLIAREIQWTRELVDEEAG